MNDHILLKKNNKSPDYINDIAKAYNILSKREKLYFITLEGINTPHVRDLSFQLKNNLFKRIHDDTKFFKDSSEYIDYLYIIEYGGIISKEKEFDTFIKDLGIHCHCIVNTSLSKALIISYIENSFKIAPDYKIQDISKSDTKEYLLDYLLKQNKTGLMTRESYNYKVNVINKKSRHKDDYKTIRIN